MLIPVPSLEEQQKIASYLELVDKKKKIYESKKSNLNDLFRTLLHQLMTAQIRVNDVDLGEIESLEAA